MPFSFSIKNFSLASSYRYTLCNLSGEAVLEAEHYFCLEFWLHSSMFLLLVFTDEGFCFPPFIVSGVFSPPGVQVSCRLSNID